MKGPVPTGLLTTFFVQFLSPYCSITFWLSGKMMILVSAERKYDVGRLSVTCSVWSSTALTPERVVVLPLWTSSDPAMASAKSEAMGELVAGSNARVQVYT